MARRRISVQNARSGPDAVAVAKEIPVGDKYSSLGIRGWSLKVPDVFPALPDREGSSAGEDQRRRRKMFGRIGTTRTPIH